MKREALSHPKMLDLAARLGINRATAIGHVTLLVNWVADFAIQGDIGKWPNGAIARGAGWDADPDTFVDAVTESGWLEKHETYRLILHDWPDHAERWVKSKLKGMKLAFLDCYGDVSEDVSADTGDDTGEDPPRDQTKPNQTNPKPNHHHHQTNNGWAAVAVELANEGMAAPGVRPTDETVQPDDILRLVEFFRQHIFAADEPLAVLHCRIRDHTPSLPINRGWKAKFTKRNMGPPIDAKTQAQMRALKADQDKALAELGAALSSGGQKHG